MTRRKLLPKPEIVIGSSIHLLTVLAAFRLAKSYRARFIMEVRDLWPRTLIDMGKMSPSNPVVRFLYALERFLCRRAERIIILPPRAGEYLAGIGVGRDKIVWIPNGVNINQVGFFPETPGGRDRLRAMYIGTLGETNSVETILEAAGLLKEKGVHGIEISIYGDGPQKRSLLEFKDKHSLDSVVFFDPVPKKEIAGVLSRADFFIHTEKHMPALERWGGSPNKLYDYLAAARPIIVSSGFVLDPIEDIGCGLKVPPENPEMLAEALVKIADLTEEERKEMGRRAHDYVKKNFAISVVVDKLVVCVFNEHGGISES